MPYKPDQELQRLVYIRIACPQYFKERYPKGSSSPYLWLLVPEKAPKSNSKEYLEP